MSETPPVLCEHCDQEIRNFYGTWIHERSGDILAALPFCSTSDTRATPPANPKG